MEGRRISGCDCYCFQHKIKHTITFSDIGVALFTSIVGVQPDL